MPSNFYREYIPLIKGWQYIFSQLKQCYCQLAMELCCGRFPKVGIAIDDSFLARDICYIDSSQHMLSRCAKVFNALAQHSRGIFLSNLIDRVALNVQAGLITGNHILDDLLIQHYLSETGHQSYQPYRSKSGFLSLVHDIVPYYQQYGDDVILKIAKDLDRLVLPSGRIILSEYPSYYERDYGVVEWPALRLALLNALQQQLVKLGYKAIITSRLPKVFTQVIICEKNVNARY